jgi:hypothetical protein
MKLRLTVPWVVFVSTAQLTPTIFADSPATQSAADISRDVGEKVPSEDPIIKDLHSLGLVNGHANIFRCACPVRDIGKATATTKPSEQQLADAQSRMQHLYDLGIRTVISFQNPSETGDEGRFAKCRPPLCWKNRPRKKSASPTCRIP